MGHDLSAAGTPSPGHAHDLGPALQPALESACAGRLSNIRWFRTDWQMGGAATAYASLASGLPDHPAQEVVIKLPVGPREHRAHSLLDSPGDTQTPEAPVPRLAAHGHELGGYDFAWLVMERLPGNPLSAHLHPEVFAELAEAAARFYACCTARWPLEPPRPDPDWSALLERAREAVKSNPSLTRAQDWTAAIKHVQRALPRLAQLWSDRATTGWCHGDLHPGNCMRRPDRSPWNAAPGCVLLDFAEVHPGHWVEDAVYLERLYWGRPQAIDGVKPVSLLAKARRAAGLDCSDDYGRLANIRRVLMAATSPAFLKREGHPAYLSAALEVIERVLPQVAR